MGEPVNYNIQPRHLLVTEGLAPNQRQAELGRGILPFLVFVSAAAGGINYNVWPLAEVTTGRS